MAKRALITGVYGFCGRHLVSYLARHNYALFGIDRRLGVALPDVQVYIGDIRDFDFNQRVIREVQPTHIIHLAALLNPQSEFEALYDVNVVGTKCLLEAVRVTGLEPTVLIAGSSAAYGLVQPQHIPIRESQPFHPINAYAVSKISQEMLAYTFYARYGFRLIFTRTFNLVGPGEPASLVCSAFANQIARIELQDINPVIRVGNLSAQRDFLDVRDAVRAYCQLGEVGQPGIAYNVCSGRSTAIQVCLNILLGLTSVPIIVEQDPARMRPSDIPVSTGDYRLLHAQTNWRPEIKIEQSLADLLEDWRQRLQEEDQV